MWGKAATVEPDEPQASTEQDRAKVSAGVRVLTPTAPSKTNTTATTSFPANNGTVGASKRGAATAIEPKRDLETRQRRQLPPSVHSPSYQRAQRHQQRTTEQARRVSFFDSAATSHMVSTGASLTNTKQVHDRVVEVADGSEIRVERSGDMSLDGVSGVLKLREVLEVPDLTDDLISVGVLDEEGYEIVIKKGVLTVFDGKRVCARGKRKSGLYVFEERVGEQLRGARSEKAKKAETKGRWHERFGHLHKEAVRQTRSLVVGMEVRGEVREVKNELSDDNAIEHGGECGVRRVSASVQPDRFSKGGQTSHRADPTFLRPTIIIWQFRISVKMMLLLMQSPLCVRHVYWVKRRFYHSQSMFDTVPRRFWSWCTVTCVGPCELRRLQANGISLRSQMIIRDTWLFTYCV